MYFYCDRSMGYAKKMSYNAKDEILDKLLKEAVEETFNNIHNITQVFRTKKYDLNKTVTNETDFLMGAVFSRIIFFFSISCQYRGIIPSSEQFVRLNTYLFSKAPELREIIIKIVGL
jgi:hypothetical protein